MRRDFLRRSFLNAAVFNGVVIILTAKFFSIAALPHELILNFIFNCYFIGGGAENEPMWERGMSIPGAQHFGPYAGYDPQAQQDFEKMMKSQMSDGWAKRQQEVDESLRKLKAILNKITLDNYYKLIGDLIEQGGDFSSAKFLDTLVDELWNKAVTQHHFLAMYTQLVKDLRSAMNEDGRKSWAPMQEILDLQRKLVSEDADAIAAGDAFDVEAAVDEGTAVFSKDTIAAVKLVALAHEKEAAKQVQQSPRESPEGSPAASPASAVSHASALSSATDHTEINPEQLFRAKAIVNRECLSSTVFRKLLIGKIQTQFETVQSDEDYI